MACLLACPAPALRAAEPSKEGDAAQLQTQTPDNHVWTSIRGTKMTGRFVSLDGGTITLQRTDGSHIKVALADLREIDQAYAKTHRVPIGLIVPWYAPNGNFDPSLLLRMADLASVKITCLPDHELFVSTPLDGFFKAHEKLPATRMALIAIPSETPKNADDIRLLNRQTDTFLTEAKKANVRVLAFQSADLIVPDMPNRPRQKDAAFENPNPQEVAKHRERWLAGLKGVEVVPFNDVLEALRSRDPRWREVLKTGNTPAYLTIACVIGVISKQPPPLTALRNELHEKLLQNQQQENFKNLGTLPAGEADAVAVLIHEISARRNGYH